VNIAALFRLFVAGIVVGMAALPPSVQACAACFGASDSAMAKGMNMGIFTLLFFITAVLVGLACFAVFIARRTARLAADAPTDSVTSTDISQPTQ